MSELYSKISKAKVEKAAAIVRKLTVGDKWFEQMDAVFGGELWDVFVKFWRKENNETPSKRDFYTPHNAHWLVEWAVVKYPYMEFPA